MLSRLAVVVWAVAVVSAAAGWYRLAAVDPGPSMTAAAAAFLDTLPPPARTQATRGLGDASRFQWHFIPLAYRRGLQIKDMTPPQREATHALLRSSLSESGYSKAVQIMELESILRELEKTRKNGPIRDPERYYVTVFGEPSASGTWAWTLEGHHLSLNFVVRDGKLASHTPHFMGANPATVRTALPGLAPEGTRVLKDEEQRAFDLLAMLSAEQKAAAILSPKAPADIRSGGEQDPPRTAPEGLPAARMTDPQRDALWGVIEAYAAHMPPAIAEARLGEIRAAGVESIHFAWAGAERPGVGHYYRVQGPTFLLEFVNVQPDAAGNPANHIHALWRDLRGDFGLAP